MSLTLIPGRGRARHRGKSGLQLQRELADAERRVAALTAGNDQLAAERNQLERQLDEAAIDLSTALDDLRISRAETERAREALTATQARLANVTAVSDLPQHTSTPPLPRFEDGPVVRLGTSPMAVTDPSGVQADTPAA